MLKLIKFKEYDIIKKGELYNSLNVQMFVGGSDWTSKMAEHCLFCSHMHMVDQYQYPPLLSSIIAIRRSSIEKGLKKKRRLSAKQSKLWFLDKEQLESFDNNRG